MQCCVSGVLLHTTATGEEDYEGSIDRRAIAHALAKEDIVSALMVDPFSGCRRPADQTGALGAEV